MEPRRSGANSETFDHTSLIRFLEARFGVMEPNISAWRRAVLGDLTSAFNFRRPNHKPFTMLPSLTKDEADAIRTAQEQLGQVAIPLGAGAVLPVQPTGVRPARALPYAIDVDAVVEPEAAQVLLRFRNAKAPPASFPCLRPPASRCRPAPLHGRCRHVARGRVWRRAGTSADGTTCWVLGPNGFLREVVGVASGADQVRPEVGVRYGRALEIALSNDGASSCTFTLTANAYRRGSISVRVKAGARRTRRRPLRHGWYDVTITCVGDDAFARRLAGHVENGRPSVTDPAIGLG